MTAAVEEIVEPKASAWLARHWPAIETNMAARRRRRPEGPKAHFEQVVKKLALRFGDLTLCKAGALHGIESDKWNDRSTGLPIEPEVRALLEERAQLRSLEGKPDMAERLTTFVLPEIRDLRSVLLLIVEQLCHFDPHDEMETWAGSFFQRSPGRPPELPDPDGNFESLEAHLAFLSHVIAPMCDNFGFWREKWLARDLVLLHSDPGRFETIRRLVANSWRNGQVESRLGYVRAVLNDGTATDNGAPKVDWEWRAPSAIAEILPDLKRTGTNKLISRCGFVVVTCESETDCYRALGRLHQRYDHRFGEIRDFIGEPAVSGYKALHTELVRQATNDTLTVHITPNRSAEARYAFTGKPQLDRLGYEVHSSKPLRFRVFTKDGEPLELPVGSCVLNFAMKVHGDFVALARKATVNRKPVDLLHRLHPGDVVWLDVGTTPIYLPDGWEERVPKHTISQIRKEFRRCFRPALMVQGWKALRERLGERSQSYRQTEEALLTASIRNADVLLKAKGAIDVLKGEARWLRQLALLDTEIQGGPRMHRLEIDEAIATHFVDLVAAEIDKVPNVDRNFLQLPDHLHGKFDRIDHSSISPKAKRMKGVIEKRTLKLLPAHAEEGEPVRRITLRESPFYFLVECRNRLDTIPRVLAAIQDEGGGILDVAANSMTVGWGVARIHLQMLDRTSIENIRQRLLRLPDVGRVTAPEKPEPPFSSAFLPAKGAFPTDLAIDLPLPFRAGAPVRGEHFYGREEELQTLKRTLQGRLDDDAGNGIVFVTGPLREGKSSLANEFIRRTRLRANLPAPLISSTVESASDSSWSNISAETSHKLWQKAKEQAEDFAGVLETPPSDDLRETIERFQAETGCVVILVFDEVVKLIGKIEQTGEAAAFERFWAWASNRERLLVIFIGPLAPLKAMIHLGSDLARLLSGANRIQLRALNDRHTAALLRAEKQRPAIQINASDKIRRRVFRLTGGQPMWIQKLAEEMFAIASRRAKAGQVTFSRQHCDLAYQHIVDTAQIRQSLEDRLFHAVEDPARVLTVLGALIERPSGHQKGHHIEAIHRYLVESDGDGHRPPTPLDLKRLRELLKELKDLGALVSRAPDRWQVASEFVQRFAEEKIETE